MRILFLLFLISCATNPVNDAETLGAAKPKLKYNEFDKIRKKYKVIKMSFNKTIEVDFDLEQKNFVSYGKDNDLSTLVKTFKMPNPGVGNCLNIELYSGIKYIYIPSQSTKGMAFVDPILLAHGEEKVEPMGVFPISIKRIIPTGSERWFSSDASYGWMNIRFKTKKFQFDQESYLYIYPHTMNLDLPISQTKTSSEMTGYVNGTVMYSTVSFAAYRSVSGKIKLSIKKSSDCVEDKTQDMTI